MNDIEFQLVRIKKGETVFLKPNVSLSMEDIESIRQHLHGLPLECKVVVLPIEVDVVAVAE